MAAVNPPANPTLANTKIVLPPESYAQSVVWGHRSFVNYVVSASPINVQNLVNLYGITGLGQLRDSHATGGPGDRAENYAAGMMKPSDITLNCWLSSQDESHKADVANGILYAHYENIEREYVIGLGIDNSGQPAILFQCRALVHGFNIDAGLNSMTNLQIILRPQNELVRI